MASKRIKGITIEIGAETQALDKALKGVNDSAREIQKELREVERSLKFNPGNTELITQKQQLLGEQVDATREKLGKLKAAERQVQAQFKRGEIGEDQYRAFKREVVETTSKLDHYKRKLKEVAGSQSTLKQRLEDTSNSLKKVGTKMRDIGGTLSTTVTAPLVAGFGLVVEGTREFREELAKLENNALLAGAALESTQGAMRELSAYSEDTGANVEAVSNLLAAGFADEELTDVVEQLSGAVLKFPDTLKIESLADGLQETLATGKAIGPFAELLERMGVDLDAFNEGLAEAATNGDAQNYVLQQLANMGLKQVRDAYRENNKELVESAEAQYKLKESLADLGETLEPVLTKITENVTGVVEAFNALPESTQDTILAIAGVAAAIGPILVVFGTLANAIGGIIGLFGGSAAVGAAGAGAAAGVGGGLAAALSGIALPVAAAVAALGTLVYAGKKVYDNWDEIKEGAAIVGKSISETWGQIKENTSETWEELKEGTSEAWSYIKGRVEENGGGIAGVIETYNEIDAKLWREGLETLENITGIKFTSILTTIQGKLEEIKQRVSEAFKKIFDFPDFNLRGSFSVNSSDFGTLPVNWNADGAIFTRPYIFGNQGVGEAGPEAVLPIEKLSGIIADSLRKMQPSINTGRAPAPIIVQRMEVRSERDIHDLAKALNRIQRRNARGAF